MKRLIGLTALCAIAGIGCGDDDGVTPMDASTDGPVIMIDGGPPPGDSGPDAGRDGGPTPTTSIGTACDAVRGCPGGSERCLGQSDFESTIGTDADPIMGAPAEYDDGYTSSPFPGGYCTVLDCDPDMPDTSCGEGARCVQVFQDTANCWSNCTANGTDNSTCRDGYSCLPGENVCFIGCVDTADCRAERQESNGIPGIQFPSECQRDAAACGGTATNFDRLVWLTDDVAGDLDCNTSTFTCEFSGTSGAEAGDACENDYDCEANGRCLTDDPDEDPVFGAAGFCTKISCNSPTRGCAGDAVCTERRIGTDICVPQCTVGEGADQANAATWVTNHGGCPGNQTCIWTGSAAATDNGYCFPANFTDVTTENIGATCADDAECWSPFGDGSCFTSLFADDDLPNGYCSVLDCGAPGRGGENSCGEGNLCVGLGSGDAPISLCFQGCETAADCSAGLGCTAITEGGETVCFPGCQETADCRSGETCVGASATELGACE
ncbi:MAG: hypothetical protein H6722_13790 [Sandaracinus sp.]|nr:hypothetical protein [Sandaracinus sp.]MCB9613515.1 hypothetical protein [Sandaracinus sp.]MCB9619724.1 hypothetical protein [Sandaracinus sp.]MCB9624027.1 hypothetical protein [Sandaracinus sp.]